MNPAVLGWIVALVALAVAIVAARTARTLAAPDDLREPRTPRGPSQAEPLPADVVSRANAFGRVWTLAGLAFAAIVAAPFLALARHGSPRGTAWTAGTRLVTPEGSPLRSDTLDVGGVATVFPEGHIGAPESATLLIRVPSGPVAYSKICTHAGCPVALYRRSAHQLYCPCHGSLFDVLDAAKPIGGPATRALPQLALDVDRDGYLIARGDFDAPVGPDSWERTV
jgi:ubiquinol-cytochrome c reductase iron-sulfur subunit